MAAFCGSERFYAGVARELREGGVRVAGFQKGSLAALSNYNANATIDDLGSISLWRNGTWYSGLLQKDGVSISTQRAC